MVNLKQTNPDIPMFAYYVNVEGKTRQRAQELLSSIIAEWGEVSDYPIVVIPATETKFECIYGGKYHESDDKLKDLINFYEEEISKSSMGNQEMRNELSKLQKTIRRFTNIRKLFK